MHWPSILTYMTSSFLIVIVNKMVLTIFEFKSVPFLMFCQSLFTIIVLLFRCSNIQRPNAEILKICFLNSANVFFGISAAGAINVAMFSALRRISIAMTLFGQWFILNKTPSRSVVLLVGMMILGAIVAVGDDLSFNMFGYACIMMNNLFTAGAQIETKRAMMKDWTKISILFWSAITSLCVFGLQLLHFNPSSFHEWDNVGFRISFTCSVCLGVIINWGASWTIEKNDALTLAVAGSAKSAIMGLVVCLGLFDPTYVFTWVNFIGLQISTVASIGYVYYIQESPVLPTTVSSEEPVGSK
jgi:solute carrier family 35